MDKILQELKDQCVCPITQEIIQNPVITVEGHTYDKNGISKWLQKSANSPTTNILLVSKQLIPNFSFKSLQQKVLEILPQILNYKRLAEENDTFRKQFTKEIDIFEKQKENLKTEILNLEVRLAEQTENYAKLKQKTQKVMLENKNLLEERVLVKQENINLGNKLVQLQKNQKSLLDELRKQYDKANIDIREKEEHIKSLQNTMASQKEYLFSQIYKLKNSKIMLEKTVLSLRYELDQVQQRLNKYRKDKYIEKEHSIKMEGKQEEKFEFLVEKKFIDGNDKEGKDLAWSFEKIKVNESQSSPDNKKSCRK